VKSKDAEKVVRKYIQSLGRAVKNGGPAYRESLLKHRRETILEAAQLFASHCIHTGYDGPGSLADLVKVVRQLPYFFDDAQADEMNTIVTEGRRILEFHDGAYDGPTIHVLEDAEQVWILLAEAEKMGNAMGKELEDLIAAVRRLDKDDPVFRQRAQGLAIREYLPGEGWGD
jgi:hypothetical protein